MLGTFLAGATGAIVGGVALLAGLYWLGKRDERLAKSAAFRAGYALGYKTRLDQDYDRARAPEPVVTAPRPGAN